MDSHPYREDREEIRLRDEEIGRLKQQLSYKESELVRERHRRWFEWIATPLCILPIPLLVGFVVYSAIAAPDTVQECWVEYDLESEKVRLRGSIP